MTNNRFTLKYRRRRQGKTNYHKRLKLLRSRKPRLTIRKTNQHTIVQFITYSPDGDLIAASADTHQLVKLGWKHATGNMPAAYLAGYLAATRAKKAGIKEAIIDIGMQRAHAGGRLFAAVKGALDAGLMIPVGEEALPTDERAVGNHINEKLSASIEAVKQKAGN